MDIIDGFLDSHYTYTASHEPLDGYIKKQILYTEREITLNHYNVIFFNMKFLRRIALSYGWAKMVKQPHEESYIIIT